jgi:hypothetical protein
MCWKGRISIGRGTEAKLKGNQEAIFTSPQTRFGLNWQR